MRVFARTAAFGAAGGLVILWVRLVFFSPLESLAAAGPPAWLGAAVFSGLALAGGGATLRRAPLVLGLVGFISFFPVGLFLLLMPGPFRLIGVLDLVLLGCAWILWRVEVDLPQATGEDPREP